MSTIKFGRSNRTISTTGKQDWRTPPELFRKLHSVFRFTIDAAADKTYPLLPRNWTEKDDALQQDWSNETAFCNPPFDRMEGFLEKAATARTALVVMLGHVPNNKYFRRHPPSYLIIPEGKTHFQGGEDKGGVYALFAVFGKTPPLSELNKLGMVYRYSRELHTKKIVVPRKANDLSKTSGTSPPKVSEPKQHVAQTSRRPLCTQFSFRDSKELRQCWRTPRQFFTLLDLVFNFTVDAAASANNALLPRFWTEEQNALIQNWSEETVFCNPPFRAMGDFVAKAQTARTALVIMHATSATTKYFRAHPPRYVAYPDYRIRYLPPIGLDCENPNRPIKSPKVGTMLAIYGLIRQSQIKKLKKRFTVYTLA